MCGRYFLNLTPKLLKDIFGVENFVDFAPFLNACPTQALPIIVRSGNSPRGGLARWGLLPPYAAEDDKALAAKLKNARSETVAEKMSFAGLWHKGRKCIIPASGFYEWPEEKIKGHAGYKISVQGGVGFAGLWNKTGDLVTFTILTQAAAPGLRHIHSRMPVMFAPALTMEWLASSPEEAERMMAQKSLQSGFEVEGQEKPISKTGAPVLF